MKEIRSIGKLVWLHLFPGFLLTIIYILFLTNSIFEGYPKLVVLGVAAMLSIVPFELGYLVYLARKEENSYNIFKVLGLNSKLTFRQYLIYTILSFFVLGLLMTLLRPVSDTMLRTVFSWIPGWYNYNEEFSQFNNYYIAVLVAVSFFIFTIIAPITEELYFRGLLLARMKWMGTYSVLVNLFLFSVYHFWSPWLILTRTIALIYYGGSVHS